MSTQGHAQVTQTQGNGAIHVTGRTFYTTVHASSHYGDGASVSMQMHDQDARDLLIALAEFYGVDISDSRIRP